MTRNRKPLYILANMTEEQCYGAAMFVVFLERALLVNSADWFTKEEIVVFLDETGKTHLPEDMIDMVKDAISGN